MPGRARSRKKNLTAKGAKHAKKDVGHRLVVLLSFLIRLLRDLSASRCSLGVLALK